MTRKDSGAKVITRLRPEKKVITTLELFTGSTLDGAIEAGKVRGMDEFIGETKA